ncbi:TnsA endonuclease N-terminal domain-containing protein [Cupriavidus oxalaticus]|uniref:TnsA endonuclease N-terminal domain-containing protein n=1 Tax=Cupriavidus oxalaticus TaxID=96344 RepID=A0A5P3VH55_9BURK|nr:TnsA endonuclease N-terminal domain-containing protein [Cupriavidus oxalaticus]QEZ44169.1 hypothetical protein D2917_07945 [Cupriavidus oxalaticus]
MNILQIENRGLLQQDIWLPPFDICGIPTGSAYKEWLPARRSRRGMAGNWRCIKASRGVALHSWVEAKALATFDFHPRVLEIRTQYPFWDRDKYLKYMRAGKPFPKSLVPTMDFMLTLRRDDGSFAYHCVSVKATGALDEDEVRERQKRETDWCEKWGITWELLTENDFPEQTYFNHLVLREFIRGGSLDELHEEARCFADRVLNSTTSKSTNRDGINETLRRVLKCASWGTIPLRKCCRLFAVAVCIGHLKIDHEYPLGEHKELYLVR